METLLTSDVLLYSVSNLLPIRWARLSDAHYIDKKLFRKINKKVTYTSRDTVSRDFLKMYKKALAKFINFFLEDICQNHIKVICSYAQQ